MWVNLTYLSSLSVLALKQLGVKIGLILTDLSQRVNLNVSLTPITHYVLRRQILIYLLYCILQRLPIHSPTLPLYIVRQDTQFPQAPSGHE